MRDSSFDRAWRAAAALLCLMIGAARAATVLVAPGGSQTPPYDTWESAFSNVQDAIDYAATGDEVLATDGVYAVSASVSLFKGVTVRSAGGADQTALRLIRAGATPTSRVVTVSHSNAVLDGFAIVNGWMGAAGYGGGVMVSASGTVRNCTVVSNYAGYGGGVAVQSGGRLLGSAVMLNSNEVNGGGIALDAGLVDRCTVRRNIHVGTASGYGGGVHLATRSAMVRSSLIERNRAARGGGGVYMGAGTIDNCTVVANLTGNYDGGGVWQGGGTAQNCVVYDNAALWYSSPNWFRSGGTVRHCCSSIVLPGTNNFAANPRFVDAEAGDFRLAPGSPCLEAGTNLAWTAGATDLDGHPRASGVPDIGAFEQTPGALQCSPWPDRLEALAPASIVLSASTLGTNQSGLYYQWDLGGDGLLDIEGFDQQTITAACTAGTYTVGLIVTNDAGERCSQVRTNLVRIGPAVSYVGKTGLNRYPFTNAATAATNIQTAINAGVDGTRVVVLAGVYSNAAIIITNGVWVESAQGATATLLRVTGTAVTIGAGLARNVGPGPNAGIRGVTITRQSTSSAFTFLYGGALIECAITNLGGDAANALRVDAGARAIDCLIEGCAMSRASPVQLVVTTPGFTSLVDRCVIRNNRQTGETWQGGNYYAAVGGVSLSGAGCVMRNSLVYGNVSVSNRAGGVYCSGGGVIENCTIAANTAYNPTNGAVGGVYLAGAGSVLRNCIAWGNTNGATGAGANYLRDGSGAIQYTCTTPAAGAYGVGNIESDPLFVGTAESNYQLAARSPCVDAGTNIPAWMAAAHDLGGGRRVLGYGPDIGAYESLPQLTGGLMIIR